MVEVNTSRYTSKNKNIRLKQLILFTCWWKILKGDSGYKVSYSERSWFICCKCIIYREVTIQRDGGIYQMAFERGKTVKLYKE